MKLIILLCSVVFCYGQQTCTSNLIWPSEASTDFSDYNDVDTETGTGSGYLMEASEYHVPDDCTCGVLKKWIFKPQAAGAIQFQIWDHLDHNTYQLKGENYFTVPADAVGQQLVFLVPERDRITIKNNYILGWYSVSSGIIGFKEGDEGYSDEARREVNMGDIVPNPANEPVFDWSSSSSTINRDRIYAIGAEAAGNTAPEFTNLPREVWIYGDETSGAFIYEVQADDIDSHDVLSLFVYDTAEDSTSPFYYDRASHIVFLAVSNPPHRTYTMTFKVQDQCLNDNTGILTIVVKNWAPILTNLPSFATVHEDTDHEVALFTVQFTDKDNTSLANSYTLNVDPAAASSIQQKYIGFDQTDRTIVSKKGANYDYVTTQQYIINLAVSDGESTTDDGYFMLYITKNDPPKFTNLENGARANVSYASTANGDTVYAVSVTDAENDPLTFTMSCDPTGCPLQIDGSNGVISTTSDFVVGKVYTPGWDLSITVSDGTTTVGPKVLTVINEDINDVPRIVNLPLANPIAVHEGTPLDTVIYTVLFVDLDTTDSHTFDATYSPTWAASHFKMNSTSGELSTSYNVLNYEDLDAWTVTVNVTVHDGVDMGQGVLEIKIRNVNEPPSFHQTKYTLEPPEEGTFGVSANTWEHHIYDEDLHIPALNEVHEYRWDCGVYTRYFRLNKDTGAVTFATKFDYDHVNFTSPYDCVVTVTDKAGLSATTTLEIDIHDENDNDPVFDSTDYYIFQTPTLEPGRLVGQVKATDIDKSSANSAIYYSIEAPHSQLPRNFLVINDHGNIYVNDSWSSPLFDYGVSYELVIKAENVKDTTGLVRSATVTATLFLSGTTTTTQITTDRPFKFIEDNRNIAWLTVAVTTGVVLLIIAVCFGLVYSVQVKRYRWCIPWIRKRLLGLTEMTKKERKRYYEGLLLQEELEDMSDGSDDGVVRTVLHPPGHGDSDEEAGAPPMLWDRKKIVSNPVARGPTVRREMGVPRAAVYDEPKPPIKKDVSKMMKKTDSKFWT